MRKTGIFILFIVIIIGMLICLPAVNGHLFKRNLLQLIDITNRDGRVKASLLEYHQGWFRSKAKVQLQRPQIAGAGPMPAIEIDSVISHGPFVKNYSTNRYTLAVASINSNIFMTGLPRIGRSPSLIEIHTLAKSSGKHWKNEIVRPGINHSIGGGSVNWGGLKGNIDFTIADNLIKELNTKITIGSLKIIAPDIPTVPLKTLSVDPIVYENETEQINPGIWVGKVTISFPSAVANFKNGTQALLEKLNLSTAISVPRTSLINFVSTLGLQKLQLPIDFPMISTSNLSLTITNLNAAGIHEVSQYLANIKNSPPKDEAEILNFIPKIITPTTAIKNDVSINTSLGSLTSKIEANLPAGTTAPVTLEVIQQKVNASVKVRAAIPLVEKLISYYAASTVKKDAANTNSAVAAAEAATRRDDLFNQSVARLLQQNKLDLSTSMQLIGYHDQNQTPEVFAANVDKLNLAPDVAAQLKSEYQTLYAQKQTQQTQQANQSALNTPEMQQQATTAMIKQIIAT